MYKTIILLLLFLTGCSPQVYVTKSGNEVRSILAITKQGDTVSVPYKRFVKYRDTDFMRYQFNNNWYWNNFRYNDPFFWNQYYGWGGVPMWTPYINNRLTPRVRTRVRPRVNNPRPQPRIRRDPPTRNRGGRRIQESNTPRQRPVVRRPVPRTRTNNRRGNVETPRQNNTNVRAPRQNLREHN